MMFAAFGAYLVEASAFRDVVSELLAFKALDQPELRSVFLCRKPHMRYIESMSDAFIGHLWGGEEDH
jgi:hypothetical protein